MAAIDVMKEVGPGNTFLTHPHTLRNYKKELFFLNREKAEFSVFSKNMVPEAKAIAKKLLNEHQVPQLEKDVIFKGDEMIMKFEKHYAASE